MHCQVIISTQSRKHKPDAIVEHKHPGVSLEHRTYGVYNHGFRICALVFMQATAFEPAIIQPPAMFGLIERANAIKNLYLQHQ